MASLRPGGESRVRQHYALIRKIWKLFAVVAERVIEAGGSVAIEWPQNCAYWKWPCVVELCERLGLQKVLFHGCAVGLKSPSKGLPIRKPWRVQSNMPELLEELAKKRCTEDHDHVPCGGSDTKITELHRRTRRSGSWLLPCLESVISCPPPSDLRSGPPPCSLLH